MVIGGLLPLGLLLLALRAWGRRKRAEEVAEAPSGTAPFAALPPVDRVAAALEAGDGREALAAGWELLARELTAQGLGRWGPEQTEREFEQTVPADWPRRSDLRQLRRQVVVGLYGPDEPGLDHVVVLLDQGRALATPQTAEGP